MKLLLIACALAISSIAHAAPTYLGDFEYQQTVRCPWNTFNTTGDSTTPGTAGTLRVYKDGSNSTEVTTGITDTRAFDSNAGDHEATIVTTDAFYTAGAEYVLRLRTATVDGQDLNVSVCAWSIENRPPLKGQVKDRGTIASGSTITAINIGAKVSADDVWNGMVLWNRTKNEKAVICDTVNSGSSDSLTVYGFNTAPSTSDVYDVRLEGTPISCVTFPATDVNGRVDVSKWGGVSMSAKFIENIFRLFDNNSTTDTAVESDITGALTSILSTLGSAGAGLTGIPTISGANAEPTSPPAANATLAAKIGWLFAVARNKLIQSGTEQCLRNDSDSSDIGCAGTTDDGSTFERGEFAP